MTADDQPTLGPWLLEIRDGRSWRVLAAFETQDEADAAQHEAHRSVAVALTRVRKGKA